VPSHVSRRNRVVDAEVVMFMAVAAPCRGPSVDAIELRVRYKKRCHNLLPPAQNVILGLALL